MADASRPPHRQSPDDPRVRVDALALRVKRLHRRVLEPDVLRALLPVRLPSVRRTASQATAREREARFAEASPAYVTAGNDAEGPVADALLTTLDTLRWWVPLPVAGDPVLVARALEHQDFPYRAITQTREVALGGTMIDIGANVGRMAIPRVILGDAPLVYCAEPDPLNYTCLVRNIRENGLAGLVLPDRLAIGRTDGTVRFGRGKRAGGHRVVEASDASRRHVIEVRSLTLDTWVERVGIDLDEVRFVKVDVQGSEVDVLHGASRVLTVKHIAWQIEIDLERLAARGYGRGDLFPLMQEHFTHFIDLNRRQTGPRVQPVAELDTALAYVSGKTAGRTDVLLFSLG